MCPARVLRLSWLDPFAAPSAGNIHATACRPRDAGFWLAAENVGHDTARMRTPCVVTRTTAAKFASPSSATPRFAIAPRAGSSPARRTSSHDNNPNTYLKKPHYRPDIYRARRGAVVVCRRRHDASGGWPGIVATSNHLRRSVGGCARKDWRSAYLRWSRRFIVNASRDSAIALSSGKQAEYAGTHSAWRDG
jgi:hypothetical protein